MATTRRRPRQMTFRGLKRRMDREAHKVEQKEMGQWFGVAYTSSFTTSATKYGNGMTLSNPEGAPSASKVEIYGVDLLVTLRAQTTSDVAIQGALMVCHIRHGQAFTDFLAANESMPEGTEQQNRARPRAFLPFALMPPLNTQGGDYQASAIIPYRPFRGRRLVVLGGETIVIGIALTRDTPAGVKLFGGLHGRYRYIVPRVT